MNKSFIAIAIAAAALAACNKSDRPDPNAPEVNAAPVVLPPAISASKIYRCKDNSLVYIDWLNDNVSANIRASETGAPTQLKGAVPGDPLVAEGYSLKGAPTDASVTLTRPAKGSQICKS